MRCFAFLLVIVFSVVTVGCSHYHGALPLAEGSRRAVGGSLAVAGILDRRSPRVPTAVFAPATKALATAARASDVSSRVDAGDIAFLLSPPTELKLEPQRLDELRRRLGYRYVIVGEQGATPVSYALVWDALWVIPLGYVVISFTTPMQLSHDPKAPRATRVLRVIDLETASIVGESYEVLRDAPEAGEFTTGEINGALAAMHTSDGRGD